MEARLTKIQSGKDAVTPEESARINKEHQDTVKQWRKRKRMVSLKQLIVIVLQTESRFLRWQDRGHDTFGVGKQYKYSKHL